MYSVGIDVGSTTAKVVILDDAFEVVFSTYQRHNAETLLVVREALSNAQRELGDVPIAVSITGSVGMGLSERYDLPFVQEVVASAEVVRQLYPDVRTLIDIGGEDAKLIFFEGEGHPPEMRMNGACAGGTGAFIDQMATLLDVDVSRLSGLAGLHTNTYPIASRCGVFAKTDVQNLLARGIPRQDIAASIFSAVAMQVLTSLARGRKAKPKVLFCGGPVTFLPALRDAFVEALGVDEEGIQLVANPELLPAIGAALVPDGLSSSLTDLVDLFARGPVQATTGSHRLDPLFASTAELEQWEAARRVHGVERARISEMADDTACFLGVDSGSTTTKMVVMDARGRILMDSYAGNHGDPLGAVSKGLSRIEAAFTLANKEPRVVRSVVTGYGEDLVRAAFGFDQGVVETLAHFRAARKFDPDVSFILDIGGQDMKAIFVENEDVRDIEINEACSSGSGSFIQAFAESMGYTVADFAASACTSRAPYDLGTRCTVFMNSKVKQSLREGASVADISAGLAYSVIKNVLHKVLKITDYDTLGDHIVVQGGTFRNPSIHRALENLIGKPVVCPSESELMGAYGAALIGRDEYLRAGGTDTDTARCVFDFDGAMARREYKKRQLNCRGCENTCTVTRLTFSNRNVFFTGNRCERIFSNHPKRDRKGVSLPDRILELLFDRPTRPESEPTLTVGIPRVLNIFEDYPFWNALFVRSGIAVRLSDPSDHALYKKGVGTIMSDSICFPAKLVHGHIYNLIEAGVDRIFYPMVVAEEREFDDELNSYNCPIVAGYPDVIRSAIDPAREHRIPFDTPAVTFADRKLLKKVCVNYLASLGVDHKTANVAFAKAVHAQEMYRADVKAAAATILEDARSDGRKVVLLMGRPYHLDPLINHKTPEILTNYGVDIITEAALPDGNIDNEHVLTQWAYPNRYYRAASWAGEQGDVELVQLNSFGCGPDAVASDEVKALLNEYGKSPTVIRVDEIDSTGSAKLRLRSMIESTFTGSPPGRHEFTPRKENRLFLDEDRDRTILAPWFSFFNRSVLTRPAVDLGYNVEMLPPPDRRSVTEGLKYANNEICYPAIILIGDLIKALQSGEYRREDVAVGLTQTGGQCRASCYLSMLRRAMISAGFEDVPIVSISAPQRGLHDQPGFRLNSHKYIYLAALGAIYSDALSILYYATATRALDRAEPRRLADRYLRLLDTGELPLKKSAVLDTLRRAVAAFNDIEITTDTYPRVAILGEIYAKYNGFANNELVEWLIERDVEVVVPGLVEFFLSWVINADVAVRADVHRRSLLSLMKSPMLRYANSVLDEVDEVMSRFSRYERTYRVEDVADNAQEVLSLTHRYGEAWLIAGEIGALASEGVHNIICLQPFGCIANHVVAKGVERRIKELHPQANILFLDTDPGVSEVNYHNRLSLFLHQATAGRQRIRPLPLTVTSGHARV
ncbi:MAG: acyl-CoA dehydratase activase [Acidimicrobiia bacterium]|nr:MAG: acyl-CoA dehydratase activase [Acidimicrobiia bacterium]